MFFLKSSLVELVFGWCLRNWISEVFIIFRVGKSSLGFNGVIWFMLSICRFVGSLEFGNMLGRER